MCYSGNEKERKAVGRSYLFSRWPEVESERTGVGEGPCEFEDICNALSEPKQRILTADGVRSRQSCSEY